jgi:hypothetical protein
MSLSWVALAPLNLERDHLDGLGVFRLDFEVFEAMKANTIGM